MLAYFTSQIGFFIYNKEILLKNSLLRLLNHLLQALEINCFLKRSFLDGHKTRKRTDVFKTSDRPVVEKYNKSPLLNDRCIYIALFRDRVKLFNKADKGVARFWGRAYFLRNSFTIVLPISSSFSIGSRIDGFFRSMVE